MTPPTVHFISIFLDIQAHSRKPGRNGNFNNTPPNTKLLSVTPSSDPRNFNDTPVNRSRLLLTPSYGTTTPLNPGLRS